MPGRVSRGVVAARPRLVPTLCVGILASADRALAHGETRDGIAVAASSAEVGAVESACRARG